MEQYRLIVSENYQRDIKNILHYISHNLGSPSTALELLDEVENSLSSLSTLPYRFNLLSFIKFLKIVRLYKSIEFFIHNRIGWRYYKTLK